MNDLTVNFADWRVSVGFSIAVVVLVLVDVGIYVAVRKKSVAIAFAVFSAWFLLSYVFQLGLMTTVSFFMLLMYSMGVLLGHLGELRWYFSAATKMTPPWNKLRDKVDEKKDKAGFDRDALYKKVENAVMTLSRQKIGALITFERRDDLTELMRNGSRLDAPVTSELLQTIFYPGTRLHDGAVVIRGDKIVAASVYFTPTNRPLIGKFGSRHRAAYGICETTDSVTIVVSEETGRVSIAFDGDLTAVNSDSFMRVFKDDMERGEKSKAVEEFDENSIE